MVIIASDKRKIRKDIDTDMGIIYAFSTDAHGIRLIRTRKRPASM